MTGHYTLLKDIPVTLNQRYRSPRDVTIPNDIRISSDVTVYLHDLSLEKRVLQDVAELENQDRLEKEALEKKRRQLEENRQKRREALKNAPVSTKSTPEPSPSETKSIDSKSTTDAVQEVIHKLEISNIGQQGTTIAKPTFDVLEFEQGLPPPGPWDTPATLQDDLHAIGEVLGVNSKPSNIPTNPSPPRIPQRPVSPRQIPALPPKPEKLSSSPIPPAPIPPRPPSDFSNPEKQLWNDVLVLGFPSQLIERGIRQFHLDKTKVLDYVVNQPKLSRQFDLEDVDLALALFDANLEKSKKFLDSFVPLKEMGFPREDVREALMLKDCNVEAAMEHLLNR